MANIGIYSSVGLGREATIGTPVKAQVYYEVEHTDTPMTPSMSKRRRRPMRKGGLPITSAPGIVDVDGSYVAPVYLDDFLYFLCSMLGDPITVGVAAPFVHTWHLLPKDVPDYVRTPIGFTMSEEVGDRYKVTSGCALHSLELRATPGEEDPLLGAALQLWGLDHILYAANTDIIGTTPGYSTEGPVSQHQATVSISPAFTTGQPVYVVNDNVDDLAFRLESGLAKKRVVRPFRGAKGYVTNTPEEPATLTMDLYFDSEVHMWKYLDNAAATPTYPAGIMRTIYDEYSVKCQWVVARAGTTPFAPTVYLTVELPKCEFTLVGEPVASENVIMQRIEARANAHIWDDDPMTVSCGKIIIGSSSDVPTNGSLITVLPADGKMHQEYGGGS